MYILPYILGEQKSSQSEFSIQTLWLFLGKKGTCLWETDEQTPVTQAFVQEEYLTANGFVGRMRLFTNTLCLFEVDPNKTPIHDFYMWLDTGAKEDDTVWRPFFNIQGTKKEQYGWEEQAKEHRLGALTVQSIWDMVLRLPAE
jgi:hypothetical protein